MPPGRLSASSPGPGATSKGSATAPEPQVSKPNHQKILGNTVLAKVIAREVSAEEGSH